MRTKADLVAAIRTDRQFWRDLVAEVGPDRLTEPGPMGEWSFADMPTVRAWLAGSELTRGPARGDEWPQPRQRGVT